MENFVTLITNESGVIMSIRLIMNDDYKDFPFTLDGLREALELKEKLNQ